MIAQGYRWIKWKYRPGDKRVQLTCLTDTRYQVWLFLKSSLRGNSATDLKSTRYNLGTPIIGENFNQTPLRACGLGKQAKSI